MPDGKRRRPLGVRANRDRVAETAAVLVLEPFFEPDLQSKQYAYRRDRKRTGCRGTSKEGYEH